ncbi:nucleoside hydrolase [Dyadobacter psychrotolerans]|uniref:Nucleoside hydrolase n=1 Tax=Dyadobacter psychrotolerans TaxID=2541721 RepID=A0A4R5DEW7_9BACT|nr:nucleoside hydrolase [Dyadobacter psychrotolerans]TDE12329.1 nucleoside hydrolase [Dyadobacter psychrotolerans]
MKRFSLWLFCVLMLISYLHVLAQKPVMVILDTDMDSDVDDVGALAMLHAYEREGKARILGIIVTSDDLYSAACTDAINTYFGRKDIPIGVSQNDSLKSFSKYTQKIASEFPHTITSNAVAENGTAVYRRLLAGQPDHSVVIVTIGHLTSLNKLLSSPPDAISKLSGKALVALKVKAWSCMGGQFPSGKEANFYRPDPASTVACLAAWKLPVTFAGWEVGNQIVTGGASLKTNTNPSSPVYRAYELYNQFKGRASWDQISVLEAIEGPETYFSVVKNGNCVVSPDGSNLWNENVRSYNHGYLTIKSPVQEISQRIDHLMQSR